MATFQGPKSHIHSIARGLLVHGEEIILCRVKRMLSGFFFPVGTSRMESQQGRHFLRELHEEIGSSNYKINSFIGVCENIFPLEEGVLQHEINIIFEVDVPNELKVNTKEDHIEFVSIAKNNLKDYKILPATLKDGLIEWLGNKKPF